MKYIYKRGKGIKKRVFHIAAYDKLGNINGSLCGRRDFDTTINIPLGHKTCKPCLKETEKISKRN